MTDQTPDPENFKELFVSTSLEARPSLSQIFGSIRLIRAELVRLGMEELDDDVDKIEQGAINFLDIFSRYLDESGQKTEGISLRELRHDLRTPVGHMVGYSELLLEDIDDRGLVTLNTDLNRLCRSARQLLALVNEGLALGEHTGQGDSAPPAAEPSSVRPVPSREVFSGGTGGASHVPASEAPAGSALKLGAEMRAEILVVDDNEANRDLLCRYLERQGHLVTEASNGREALIKLEGHNFDMILLDIMMPEMDGYQVLAYIKEDPSLRHIPVIMISAMNEMDNVVTCVQMGAEDYLAKPFNPVLLQARVGACLEKKLYRDQEQRYLQQLEIEQAKSEKLLLNILPGPIANRLKRQQSLIADSFASCSVLFADIITFTEISSRLSPQSLVKSLNLLFSSYDSLADRFGLEKIKTIGDCYMCASGLPIPRDDHAEVMLEFAFALLEETDRLGPKLIHPFQMRVGISSGQAVAGVIGYRKFCYDLWGDTVNTASRMSGVGSEPGIVVTSSTYDLVKDKYQFDEPLSVAVKGKGNMLTYRVLGRNMEHPQNEV